MTKPIQNLQFGKYSLTSGGYEDLIESMEIKTVTRCDLGDYSGDTVSIVKDAQGRYGYLEFGWGSCSGCDALQACKTMQEAEELRDELYESIKWFDNQHGLWYWLKDRDWQGQWVWGDSGFQTWITETVDALQPRFRP